MADGFDFELKGADAVLGKLKSVSSDVRKKGGRFALRKAAKLLALEVQSNALRLDDPKTSNSISKNVAIRWSGQYFKAKGDLKFRVGILGGSANYANDRWNRRKKRAGKQYVTDGSKSNPGGDTFYWRFLEYGTERASAKPLMRSAAHAKAGAAADEFVRQYGRALDRAIRRAKKAGQ